MPPACCGARLCIPHINASVLTFSYPYPNAATKAIHIHGDAGADGIQWPANYLDPVDIGRVVVWVCILSVAA
jgi:hypothetical protein